jgi:hypothetical protein
MGRAVCTCMYGYVWDGTTKCMRHRDAPDREHRRAEARLFHMAGAGGKFVFFANRGPYRS